MFCAPLNALVAYVVDFLDEQFEKKKFEKKEFEKKEFEEYLVQLHTDCPICLEPFSMDDFVDKKIHRTACKHFYHHACIAEWVKRKSLCPKCNTPISFSKESGRWGRYLKKIDQVVCEKFPETLRRDEALAYEISEQINQGEAMADPHISK